MHVIQPISEYFVKNLCAVRLRDNNYFFIFKFVTPVPNQYFFDFHFCNLIKQYYFNIKNIYKLMFKQLRFNSVTRLQ